MMTAAGISEIWAKVNAGSKRLANNTANGFFDTMMIMGRGEKLVSR